MDLGLAFQQIGIALGLGLLVGLQRERVATQLAGFRTFGLTAVLGTVCAQLAPELGAWLPVAGLFALAAVTVAANHLEARSREPEEKHDPGLTTEVALLLLYLVGVYLVAGRQEVAIVVGAGTAVLLYLKPQLHGLAGRLGEDDFRTIMQFALISLVILPILPDRSWDPYGVLNLQQIWFMVVLVVGLGIAGYVAYKLFGETKGMLVAGLLGGMISSTATTVSYARRTRESPEQSRAAGLVILLASGVVFVRVLVELAVVAPAVLRQAAAPFGILLAAFTLVIAGLWWHGSRESEPVAPPGNPSQLRPALVFGLLYAAVLFLVAAVNDFFGAQGLWVVAALSGLTDMDAVTLSLGRMATAGQLPAGSAWRLITVASLSNLAFKVAAVAFLGSRKLLARVAFGYAVVAAVAVVLLVAWP